MWLCGLASSRFFLVPGWALPGGCGPAWLAAGWAWPWLAGAGPGWLGLALAAHTAHTHKTHTPPHLNEVNLGVCSQNSRPPSSLIAAREVLFEHTHVTPPHAADCTAVLSCCLAGDK